MTYSPQARCDIPLLPVENECVALMCHAGINNTSLIIYTTFKVIIGFDCIVFLMLLLESLSNMTPTYIVCSYGTWNFYPPVLESWERLALLPGARRLRQCGLEHNHSKLSFKVHLNAAITFHHTVFLWTPEQWEVWHLCGYEEKVDSDWQVLPWAAKMELVLLLSDKEQTLFWLLLWQLVISQSYWKFNFCASKWWKYVRQEVDHCSR